MKTIVKPAFPLPATNAFSRLMHLWKQPVDPVTEPFDIDRLVKGGSEQANMLQLSPGIIWIINVGEQQFAFVSDNVQRILGYKTENFIREGVSFLWELMHPAHQESAWISTLPDWQCLMKKPDQ